MAFQKFFTQQELADLVGASRPVVSTLLNDFETGACSTIRASKYASMTRPCRNIKPTFDQISALI